MNIEKQILLRFIVMGKKILPDPSKKSQPFWGFVEMVTKSVEHVKTALKGGINFVIFSFCSGDLRYYFGKFCDPFLIRVLQRSTKQRLEGIDTSLRRELSEKEYTEFSDINLLRQENTIRILSISSNSHRNRRQENTSHKSR